MAHLSSPTPPTSFSLNRSLFNESVYYDLRSLWFAGLTPDAKGANLETAKRWFGVGVSADEKASFDSECRSKFGLALESISPSYLALPPFKSYEDDLIQSQKLSAPFLKEVKAANDLDAQKGTETLLSLILLLDQMPRNIYRENPGLRLVYNHYDRLAWSLIRSASQLEPSPALNPAYTLRPLYMTWHAMPLIHAEDLASHDLADQYFGILGQRAADANNDEALEFIAMSTKAQKAHRDILQRFGRYPHRNECLGRQATTEEVDWLRIGETFGVKQNAKKEKDGL